MVSIHNYLKKSSITQSMSAKGNAYDNAVIESFFGTLKCETIYLQKVKSLADLIRTLMSISIGIIMNELN